MSYGVGVGYINVQLQYQKFFDMPLRYDLENDRISVSPNWGRPWRMPLWYISNIGVIVGFLFSCFRLTQIFMTSTSEELLQGKTGEPIAYGFMIAASLQAIITWYTVEKDPHTFAFLSGQIFRAYGIRFAGWPSIHRLPSVGEMAAYYISNGFCMFPLAFVVFPFKRSFDPISVMLAPYFPYDIPRKLIAGSVYGAFAFYASISCCVQVLIGMVCCSTNENLTKRNIELSQRYVKNVDDEDDPHVPEHPFIQLLNRLIKISFEILDKFISIPPPPEHVTNRSGSNGLQDTPVTIALQSDHYPHPQQDANPLAEVAIHSRTNLLDNTFGWTAAAPSAPSKRRRLTKKFQRLRLIHNQMTILIPATNRVCNVWNPGIAGVGIGLVIITNVGLVKFYDELDALLIPMAFVNVMVLCLIDFFCTHARRPGMYAEEFIQFWEKERLLLPRVENKQVNALVKFSYTMGPFFKVSHETKICILDTIKEFTMDFLIGD